MGDKLVVDIADLPGGVVEAQGATVDLRPFEIAAQGAVDEEGSRRQLLLVDEVAVLMLRVGIFDLGDGADALADRERVDWGRATAIERDIAVAERVVEIAAPGDVWVAEAFGVFEVGREAGERGGVADLAAALDLESQLVRGIDQVARNRVGARVDLSSAERICISASSLTKRPMVKSSPGRPPRL